MDGESIQRSNMNSKVQDLSEKQAIVVVKDIYMASSDSMDPQKSSGLLEKNLSFCFLKCYKLSKVVGV